MFDGSMPAIGKTCGTCKHVGVFTLAYATQLSCRQKKKIKSLDDSCADHAWKSKEAEVAYKDVMGVKCSCPSKCPNCNCGR